MAGELVRVNGKLGVLIYHSSIVKVLFQDSILEMKDGSRVEYTGEMVVIDNPKIRNGLVADVMTNDLNFIAAWIGHGKQEKVIQVPTGEIKWYKTKKIIIPTLSELFKVLENTGYIRNAFVMYHPEYEENFPMDILVYAGKDIKECPYPVRDEWCCQVYSWPDVVLDNFLEVV